MSDNLEIGLILKPQGVMGELKIKPITDDAARFKDLKTVIIKGETHKVLHVRVSADAVYMVLSGIADRNGAEAYRNESVFVSREDAVKLPNDRYFIVDIIGCHVYTESAEIGEVKDVTSANVDIFTVETAEKKTLRFPFLKDLVKSVDIESKRIIVEEKRLKEVALYED